MTLQLQAIQIPEGEYLAENLFTIPTSGGLIGRRHDCLMSLSDSSPYDFKPPCQTPF